IASGSASPVKRWPHGSAMPNCSNDWLRSCQSKKFAGEVSSRSTPRFGAVCQTVRMRSSREYGSVRSKTPFTTLKIAVFVAIPTDNINTTTMVKPGFVASVRILACRSRTKFFIVRFLRRYSYRSTSRASTFIEFAQSSVRNSCHLRQCRVDYAHPIPNKQSVGSIYWRSNATYWYMPVGRMVCFCIRLPHSFRARNDRPNQRHGKGSIGRRSAWCRNHCDPNRDGSKKNCRHERNR